MRAPRGSSAGDVDYDVAGVGYAEQRRPDPRVAAWLRDALGVAQTVLNVGAGAGSYEPIDRDVTAVEPSAAMRAQRPAHLSDAIDAVAERLPFDDDTFDAAMAVVTVHQWPDPGRGLRELRRVTRGPIVVLTFDPEAMGRFWLADYAPELLASESPRYPTIAGIRSALGGSTSVDDVPIPLDCTDGFMEAFYGRPEAFLDPKVRRAQSSWTMLDEPTITRSVESLRAAITSGEWDRRHAALRAQPEYKGSLRLVTAAP